MLADLELAPQVVIRSWATMVPRDRWVGQGPPPSLQCVGLGVRSSLLTAAPVVWVMRWRRGLAVSVVQDWDTADWVGIRLPVATETPS